MLLLKITISTLISVNVTNVTIHIVKCVHCYLCFTLLLPRRRRPVIRLLAHCDVIHVYGANMASFFDATRGVTKGGKGVTIPRALNSPNNVTSTFFNAANFLPKDLTFEHGGPKLASSPGRHLTSLCPGMLQNSNVSGVQPS